MLAASRTYRYVHEPFNNMHIDEQFGESLFPHWFMYITTANGDQYQDKLARMLGLGGGKSGPPGERPLMKDPIAFFSAEWIAEAFEFEVICMVRHPAAFVSSIVGLGWNADPAGLLSQPLLVDGPLSGLEDEIRHWDVNGGPVEKAAMLWRVIYGIALLYKRDHGGWLFHRQEDLARAPARAFGSIARRLAIPDADAVLSEAGSTSASDNPGQPADHWDIRRNSGANIDGWKSVLTARQVEITRAITGEIAAEYYEAADW